jgi:hypothetical protein
VSYSDEWFAEILKRRQWKEHPRPIEPVPQRRLGDLQQCEHSTTWKPFSEMTAEERRKALSEREGGK